MKQHRRRNLALLSLGAILVAGILCLLGYKGIGIPCLFHQITGLQCPGCGNTRAVLALLRLDLKAALAYNLMLPAELFYLGWVAFHSAKAYLKTGTFSYRPPIAWLDAALLAMLLLWWVLRNLL